MKVGSLFSGIGGIELGFEREGFETAWFVEKEPFCQAILRKHWPGTPIYGDITKINFKELPPVDILTGGFPCQDISNAGKREGISGEKSGLWKEYLRAISEIRPKFAIIENVSALRHRGMHEVLCDLTEVGYDVEWHCIPASSIGAPHRRDRIFILAYSDSNRWKQSTDEQFSTSCEKMADSNLEELSGSIKSSVEKRESKKEACGRSDIISNANNFNYWKQCKESLREKNRRETWKSDAGILRVANGVPNRVHRIKAIGNAVVPQVAQFIARRVKEMIALTSTKATKLCLQKDGEE